MQSVTGAYAIVDGVDGFSARTPTLLPATHTNSYALGGRDVILVEPATPFDDERRAWLEWARSLASTGRRLVALFVTHHHADHVGGAAFFAHELDLPIWAHSETARRLSGVPVARRLEDGDALILDGAVAQRWQVLHTPGHAPGHLCLHEAALGVLVAGDMVASEGTILIDPSDGDMGVYLEQLRRLSALGANVALPAHGAPIEHPETVFGFYVKHRLLREQKVLDALIATGVRGAHVDELVPHAYADTAPALWPFAARSLASHLTKLERDGLASRRGELYVATQPS